MFFVCVVIYIHSIIYTDSSSISSLILLIASSGFKSLGQTSTQFIMPRHRNTLNGSAMSAKRSSLAVSRLSAIKRYDCNNAAGPMYLSGFHQKDGHDVVQQAHKIHSYKPSNCALSSGDCSLSVAGAG